MHMKLGKKVLIVVGVLLLVVAGVVFYVMTNLDSIVKAAIEKYGSETTKTAVRVSSVKIRLSAGSGEISGLTVANPRGFSSPYIFSLEKISAKIDVHSITSSPIVINELRISSPQVVYELNQDLDSNLSVLKKNVQAASASSTKKAGKEKPGSKEIRIIIKKLVIGSGSIEAHAAAFKDRPQSVTLKHFEMANVGGREGATPARIAEEILTTLLKEVGGAVVQAGLEKNVKNEVGRAVKRLLGQ
jgi:hypothetical protein